MRIEFRLDPDATEIRVRISAAARTREVDQLIARIETPPERLAAYGERGEVLIEPAEILRVYTQQRKLFVECARGTYQLRTRLYELEERLDAREFVRISNSEIVNRRRILGLDFGLTGTIRLTLEGGTETYVSRRYVSRIRKSFENGGGTHE